MVKNSIPWRSLRLCGRLICRDTATRRPPGRSSSARRRTHQFAPRLPSPRADRSAAGSDLRGSDLLIPWNYAEFRRDSVGAQLVCARSVTMRGVGRTQGVPLRRTLRRRIGQTPAGGHRPPQVNQRSTPAQLFSPPRAHPPGGIRRSEAGQQLPGQPGAAARWQLEGGTENGSGGHVFRVCGRCGPASAISFYRKERREHKDRRLPRLVSCHRLHLAGEEVSCGAFSSAIFAFSAALRETHLSRYRNTPAAGTLFIRPASNASIRAPASLAQSRSIRCWV